MLGGSRVSSDGFLKVFEGDAGYQMMQPRCCNRFSLDALLTAPSCQVRLRGQELG